MMVLIELTTKIRRNNCLAASNRGYDFSISRYTCGYYALRVVPRR